jgi:hypothetical protein
VGHRVGDRVRVKSLPEIMSTLDDRLRLENLPFMAEMAEHCGKVYEVTKSAHKTCDTVNRSGGRNLANSAHLADLRCSGATHGGCDADCLIFWKDAWLEPVDAAAEDHAVAALESDLARLTSAGRVADNVYACQATELPAFTSPLPWWDVRQYVRDVASGNESMVDVFRFGFLKALQNLVEKGVGYRFFLSIYNRAQAVLGGMPYPSAVSRTPAGARTPTETLNLAVGEWVEVKSYEDIAATLDGNGKNRGMRFDIEMKPFCGRRFRVAKRVERILVEQTGELMDMKTPSVILEGVVCQSKYSGCRMFCPRQIPSFWREIWLRRVDPGQVPVTNL